VIGTDCEQPGGRKTDEWGAKSQRPALWGTRRAREKALFAGNKSDFASRVGQDSPKSPQEAPMQHQLVTTPEARPSRAQIEPAALALLSRHSAGLLATARRYSVTPEDAEDAYQRGVEILLTKAPTTTEDELLPWLRTVVKHEAFAVRKSTGRSIPADEPLDSEAPVAAWTDERAERYERLRLGAEAMSGLKPQEIRCLLLKAEGLSYREICEATGFSYTKVNRCITEGRRAFLKRVANIESGAECDRLAPLISKVADGEASAAEMRAVRPHMKGCLACKATLREYRATPTRLAGLVPPVVVLASGSRAGFVGRMLAGLHERFGSTGDVVGAKAAAVATSAVVLVGGGAAGVEALHHDPPRVAPSAFAADRGAASVPTATPIASQPPAADPATPDPVTPAATVFASQPAAPAAQQPSPDPQPAANGPEFDPGTGSSASDPVAPIASKETAPAASDNTAPAQRAPSTPRSTRTGSAPPSAGGEFGP
jgi:RNA polymerase sigma factor (sigma-70 family)